MKRRDQILALVALVFILGMIYVKLYTIRRATEILGITRTEAFLLFF